jgi:adenylylsulfate kinase
MVLQSHQESFSLACTNKIEQAPLTVWLTGLSGAGKTTIAYELVRRLNAAKRLSMVLDGDSLRNGLCKDLGFSTTDRAENIRRIAEVAALMNDAGLLVVVACISPRQADREIARGVIGHERFLEVHVSTPLAVCESRDPKGLYHRARAGALPEFTGVSAPYECPDSSALTIDTTCMSAEECVDILQSAITAKQCQTLPPDDVTHLRF